MSRTSMAIPLTLDILGVIVALNSSSSSCRVCITSHSLPNNLDQNSLRPVAVEFAVEDLLPGAEIELAFGDRHHHFTPHDLALQVGVGIVLAGAVVVVMFGVGIERSKLLEPDAEVMMQALFV